MRLTTKNVYDYYVKRGVPKPLAAGLAGNFAVESGNFDPNVISGKRRGDGGTAWYIPQLRGDRVVKFRAWAEQKGYSPTDPMVQLEWPLVEMDPNSPFKDEIAASRRERMFNAKTADDAADAVRVYYERSSKNPKLHHAHKRRAYANRVMGTAPGTELAALGGNVPTPSAAPRKVKTQVADAPPSSDILPLPPSAVVTAYAPGEKPAATPVSQAINQILVSPEAPAPEVLSSPADTPPDALPAAPPSVGRSAGPGGILVKDILPAPPPLLTQPLPSKQVSPLAPNVTAAGPVSTPVNIAAAFEQSTDPLAQEGVLNFPGVTGDVLPMPPRPNVPVDTLDTTAVAPGVHRPNLSHEPVSKIADLSQVKFPEVNSAGNIVIPDGPSSVGALFDGAITTPTPELAQPVGAGGGLGGMLSAFASALGNLSKGSSAPPNLAEQKPIDGLLPPPPKREVEAPPIEGLNGPPPSLASADMFGLADPTSVFGKLARRRMQPAAGSFFRLSRLGRQL